MTSQRPADPPDPRRTMRSQSTGWAAQARPRVTDEVPEYRLRPAAGRQSQPTRPAAAPSRPTRESRQRPGRDEAIRRLVHASGPAQRPDRRTSPGYPPGASAGPDPATTRPAPAPTRPGRSLRPARPVRKRQTVSHRGRRTKRDMGARVNNRARTRGALIIVLTLLAVALGKLVTIQTVDAGALAVASLHQKQLTQKLVAERGTISDRNGVPLALTVAGKAIAARPADFENDSQRSKVADILVAALGTAVSKPALMAMLSSKHPYIYLAHSVMPAVAETIMAQIAPILVDKQADPKTTAALLNAVVTEDQAIRVDPDGPLAASVVGTTGRNDRGMAGIESKFGALLRGTNGTRTLQLDSRGIAIPGTITNFTPAVDGTGITLTLDQDLQYTVQQLLAAQVSASQARGGCAVVKGISDGQIYAMACDEPARTAAQFDNRAISTPFEPGSVNKVVTFAAALDRGLITPTTVLSVDGQIALGGREIHDAWVHGPINMTATGIIAKSSNVGTLMIAQKLGPTVFAQELAKYALGRKTGIELAGESAGSYPVQSQWSATSFANLPIGQGVSMTLLQLVDMYQAIGNKGVMVAPTIIAGTTKKDVFTASAPRSTSQVMKPTTAATLLGMLRGTVQGGDYYHRGTASKAAITGYQVAGKTGTGQQINPATHAYSQTLTNATFAGIVPADNPKYAIAIMLDAPVNGSEGGDSAAPLFKQIASYALRAADVPPSKSPAPIYDLYVQ